jgi:hypothetical protein
MPAEKWAFFILVTWNPLFIHWLLVGRQKLTSLPRSQENSLRNEKVFGL